MFMIYRTVLAHGKQISVGTARSIATLRQTPTVWYALPLLHEVCNISKVATLFECN